MLEKKLWLYDDIPAERAELLSKKAGISPLLAKIFISRGISDTQYINSFLNPRLDELHDPFLLKDMDKAVERIARGIQNQEKILVYGDYDVDGTTSASILSDFLMRNGALVDFYIPDRLEEGYGLSIGAIDRISAMEASLIITVDCGITAVDEVRYAIDKGLDVVVTDHHQCKEELPEAYAVVNPCRPDCSYPFKQLAGVGVAFKLIIALCDHLHLGDVYKEYLDIVALGTVADVVPLVNENRILVKYGIKRLESTENVGLKALINCAGLKDKPISSFGISFGLAPRINAAGRVGDASRAVKLFTSKDEESANRIAAELNEENKFRQDTEAWIMQQAIQLIESEIDFDREKVIVAAGEGWHHGIIGIVASKITEKYYRPCILLTHEDGVCKGSARSIEGFNLFDALTHCKDLLEKFGGHELAAGLALKFEKLDAFKKMINAYADEILTAEDLVPKLKVDVNLDKNDISMKNIRELDLLAPFGAGNPGPVFIYKGLRIGEIKTVGENKHLKLKLMDGSFYTEAIGFNMGAAAEALTCNDRMDVACTLEINSWNSNEKIQFNLKDLRYSKRDQMERNFYSTLHRCLSTDFAEMGNYNGVEISEKASAILDEADFHSSIQRMVEAGSKVAILVNDIDYVEFLDKTLKNSLPGGKGTYRICYATSGGGKGENIHIIANPEIGFITHVAYEAIYIAGNWVDRRYLKELINSIDKYKIFLYNIGVYNFDAKDIVPDRNDLGAVYQYIKNNYRSALRMDNMHDAAQKIGESYKIAMNYFKLRQGVEIFEELGLLKKEYYGLYGVFITMADNIKIKTNLENSAIFRRLQALKGQL